MSLINKMLQDLDARGVGPSGLSNPSGMHTAPAARRDQRLLILTGVAVGVAAVVAVGGWFGWRYWQMHRGSEPAAVVVAQSAPQPVAPVPAPAAVPVPVPALPPVPVPVPVALPAQAVPAAASAGLPSAAPAVAHKGAATGQKPAAAAPVPVEAHPVAPLRPDADKQMPSQDMRETLADRREQRLRNQPATISVAAPSANGTVRIEMDPAQTAQNAYRRAVVALQEGRVNEALANLEQSLEVDPRNDAARQTYVSLLLENKRADDAIRQLRLALGINPQQPGMAMLLARLQLERNGPALETLLRTQPYAAGNADYQGFLAGVLQRKQRNAEAVERYQDALKLAPERGVWWMGLGISLQAEKRLPEARDAYSRAKLSGSLTPELQLFVERKLEQMAR